jgi:hypothetical protein
MIRTHKFIVNLGFFHFTDNGITYQEIIYSPAHIPGSGVEEVVPVSILDCCGI